MSAKKIQESPFLFDPPASSDGHVIKFCSSKGGKPICYKVDEFENLTGLEYLFQLRFESIRVRYEVGKQVQRAISADKIDPECFWLGEFYREQILTAFLHDVSIRWVSGEVGYGLFTNPALYAGDFVAQYTGEVKRRGFFSKTHTDYCFSYPSSPFYWKRFTVDAQKAGNETRFMNHSEDPNCEVSGAVVGDMMVLIVRAIKNIDPGSQLTFDYGESYWERRTKPVPIT